MTNKDNGEDSDQSLVWIALVFVVVVVAGIWWAVQMQSSPITTTNLDVNVTEETTSTPVEEATTTATST